MQKIITTDEFAKALKNTADIICASKKLRFMNRINSEYVSVDLEIVLQVCENLLSNAMRYAETMVEIVCTNKDQLLIITVSDDGKGFDSKAIEMATDPFYTTEKKSGGEHFGLGLNICKILCQKHGGNVVIHNKERKGACITVSFAMKKELEEYEG